MARLQLHEVEAARRRCAARPLELCLKVVDVEAQVILRDHRDGQVREHNVLPGARMRQRQADSALGQFRARRPLFALQRSWQR